MNHRSLYSKIKLCVLQTLLQCLRLIDKTWWTDAMKNTLIFSRNSPITLYLNRNAEKKTVLVLNFFHFSFENIDLFNPNDQGNWSAWATALLQYRTCVRTICGNSAGNCLFKQKKKIYCKWNELMFSELIHNLCSLKTLFQCYEACQV